MQPHCHTPIHPIFKQLVNQAFPVVGAPSEKWSPRVDIVEEDHRFVITADIPGIDPKDIEIELDKNVLIVKGKRDQAVLGEGAKLARSERWKGDFVRKFDLPETIDPEAIVAQGHHGVLEISLPKRPQPTPRRINVA